MIYYQDELITLYVGDCLEQTEWLNADVLVTDPPYGIGYVESKSKSYKQKKYKTIAADDTVKLRDKVLELWADKPALVFGSWRKDIPKGTRNKLIWDKQTNGMGDLECPFGTSYEEIYLIGKGFKGKRRSSVISIPTIPPSSKERPNHPTPKPVELMTLLLSYCPQETIADPFTGSGATLIAAKLLGKKAIGVELEEEYAELTAKRLSQGVLF